jgi:spermidine synthase
MFSAGLVGLFSTLKRLTLWTLALPVIVCGAFLQLSLKRARARRSAVLPLVVLSTGFAGMAADLLVIFTFQSLYGYLYHWVGLLIAAFMGGLGLGSFQMTRKLERLERQKTMMLKVELAWLALWALTPLALVLYHLGPPTPGMAKTLQWGLLVLNVIAGFLVGAQFALSSRMWMESRDPSRPIEGVMYAFDLIGAFFASILVAVIFVPVLGVIATCLFVAIIKLMSLSLTARLPSDT